MSLSVNSAQKQGYLLDIIGYDKWPSLSVKYSFTNIGPVPQLQLNYKFDTNGYLPLTSSQDADDIEVVEIPEWQQKAAHALVVYKNIYYQLNWHYTTDEKPDEQIRIIQHAATTNLSPAEPINFSDEDMVKLLKFVKTIINWLQRLTDSTATSKLPTRAPAMQPILLPITGATDQTNIIELAIKLVITRMDVDTQLPAGQSTQNITPDVKTGVSLKAGQKAFAQKFETAFNTTGPQLKLAAGKGDYNNNTQLWVVRLANNDTENGIFYTISPDAATPFAPVPLSRTLISGSANLYTYTSGQGIDWVTPKATPHFHAMDLDVLMTSFLSAVDEALAPATMDAVLTCVTLQALQQPDNLNPLQELLTTKTGIAGHLKKLLTPVVTQLNGNLEPAAKHLKTQLNYKLANFYSTTAIVQFNASVTANSGPGLVNLYGKIEPASADRSASYSEALLPNAVASTVSFTVNINNPAAQSYLPINVTYQPQGLDYKFDEAVIIPLSFIILPAKNTTVLSANVPVVLRAYPQPLTITGQSDQKTYADDAVTLQTIKLYDYIFQYRKALVAQDTTQAQIIINKAELPVAAATNGDANALFESLIQFENIYAQVSADLKASLPIINNETTVESRAYKTALPALTAMAQLAGKVKSALSSYIADASAALRQNPEAIAYTASLIQSPVKPIADERLQIQVRAQKGQPNLLSIPAPQLDGYDAVLLETIDTDTSVSNNYAYVDAGKKPLLFNDKLGNNITAVRFSSIDILKAESVNLVISEWRNKTLLPNPEGSYYTTDDRFIYTVTENIHPSTFKPGLFWDNVEFNLATINTTSAKANLQVCLQLFFSQLFNNANNVIYDTSVKVTYEYKIDEGGFMPPIVTPVIMVPGFSVSPENKSDFAMDLYNAVKAWLDAVKPDGLSARFYFEVQVFTSLKTTATPLLTINRLYMNLSDVN